MTTTTPSNQSTKWVIIILTLITALTHLGLAAADPSVRLLFGLNGLAYLVLLAAYYLPIPFLQGAHGLIKWAFIAFTALTIILYVVFSFQSGGWSVPLGPIIKLVELALIFMLWRS